jgi:urea transport system permease protein
MNAGTILRLVALFLALVLSPGLAHAQTGDAALSTLVDALAPGNFKDREAAATALARTEDPRAVPVLQKLTDGELYVVKATGKVVFATASGSEFVTTDPVTSADHGTFPKAGIDKVKVNNGLRRVLRTLIGQLTLLSDDRGTRLSAAQSVLRDANPDNLELLDSALAAETDPAIRTVMEVARAAIILKTDAPAAEKAAAAQRIADWGGREAITLLNSALAGAPLP